MIATNHALTGALIGLSIANPAIAVPAALLSHFACDALPHYGDDSPSTLRSKRFALQLLIDASLCGVLVGVLAVTQPANWLLAAICAFIAAAPDFAWLPGYIRVRKGRPFHEGHNALMRFFAR